MEWIADPSVGAWLRERLDPAFSSSMHGVVPRGYQAYARVLHPAIVRSLPDRAVPTHQEWDDLSPDELSHLSAQFIDEPTTWADTAAAFGTTLHPLAQWQRLVRTPTDEDWNIRLAPDGREFTAPEEGRLDAEALTAIARHLVAHTTTPDAGVAALWDGHGGLLGHLGHASRGFFLPFQDEPLHRAVLDRSIHDPLNNAFRRKTWQEGILSQEISQGPRLSLPDRDYVLFTASAADFADPDWVRRAPWRDLPAEEHGFPPDALSPGILWPEDRAWVLVSEVDFDSTVIGGSAALIDEIVADERLEAMRIPADADLTWDGDEVNR